MGCNIYINKKLIIDSTIGMLETMHYVLKETSQKHSISNSELNNLFDKMYTAVESMCSYGFDFSDHVKTKATTNLLLQTINLSINKFKNELNSSSINDILILKKELSLYKNTLDL